MYVRLTVREKRGSRGSVLLVLLIFVTLFGIMNLAFVSKSTQFSRERKLAEIHTDAIDLIRLVRDTGQCAFPGQVCTVGSSLIVKNQAVAGPDVIPAAGVDIGPYHLRARCVACKAPEPCTKRMAVQFKRTDGAGPDRWADYRELFGFNKYGNQYWCVAP